MTEQPSSKLPSSLTRPEHIRFWRGQVWRRRRRLACDWTLFASLVSGIILTVLVFHSPGGQLEIREIGAAGLSYAAIAFGACVTGVVLTLSLSSPERVRRWATTTRSEGSEFSNYSDLVFVLTWSAVMQLGVIALSLGAYLFGAKIVMAPHNARLSHYLVLDVSLTIATYAFLQLFTVVSTLSLVSYVINDDANRSLAGKGHD